MKTKYVALLSLLISVTAFGQGAVVFNNHIVGVVEAKVMLPDGTGAGAGWSAQLYAGAEGATVADLHPLTPSTTFRTSSSLTLGYVNPVDVVIPGMASGDKATIVMRVFNGTSFESSPMHGESSPTTITLGGGMFPPSDLVGLQGFTVGLNPASVTVTASAGANGSVMPASVTTTKGESVIFVAAPSPNFTVAQWSVDGIAAQTGGATFTLSNVQTAHAVSVTFSILSEGGGSIQFNTHVVGVVDARVVYSDGTGVGAGWTAQLYGGAEGTPVASLSPLSPTTIFRTSSTTALGYVDPVDVMVPGVPPGSRATIVMRAFQGASFEAARSRGESAPINITVGGGIFPPPNLVGLRGFVVKGPYYAITASASAHGSISPSGTIMKLKGETATFEASPDAGYTVDQWSVNGKLVQTGGRVFLLRKIQSDATVSLTFKLASFDGAVVFNNRIVGVVDARVLLANGNGAGAGWTAQLYGGPSGASVAELKPLFPTTSFRTVSDATLGYVNEVEVSVPGVASGANATLVMRVYNGDTFETSLVHGESAPITIAVGGGLMPPTDLVGLKGFTLPPEPPPSSEAGTIDFNNRVVGTVDARVVLSDGTGVGAGWTAQLYGGPEGGTLAPLLPTTTFRTSSSATLGYVEPVVVTVPGVAPGSKATIVMTAYLGKSFETAVLFGQSTPITVPLGGGLFPPTNLDGLTGFTVVSRTPIITKQPANQSVIVGSSVTFNVQASGSGPLSYQWKLNGAEISSATSSSLTIASAKASDAGAYTVTVRNSSGEVTSTAAILTVFSNSVKGDLTGDGFTDLLFENEDGFLAVWSMDGANLKSASYLTPNNTRDGKWRLVGTGSFNSDAHEDLLFQHKDGSLAVWFMDGTQRTSAAFLDPVDPGDEDWRVVGTGDFNNDGKTDILFQHDDGTLAVWYMDGIKLSSATLLKPDRPGEREWRVVGTGDLNSDGKTDLIFQHEDGTLGYWQLDGVKLVQSGLFNPFHPRDKRWHVSSIVDLNHDGKLDLVFQHQEDGTLAVWFMDGIKLIGAQLLTPSRPGGSWNLVGP